MTAPEQPLTEDQLTQAAARLMQAAGLADTGARLQLQPLTGGANNRVFRVEAGGSVALLKAYFQHPADSRDRLGAEFGFSTFAWNAGVRQLPRPLGCDRTLALGLYEFVEGRRLSPDEVTFEAVGEALDFVRDLNRHTADPAAQALAPGSEACFSLAEHLQQVERRVERLRQIDEATAVGHDAARFVREALAPAWASVREDVVRGASRASLSLEAPIAEADRCLSPSDFGFHNALRATHDGRLRFIDFEYAGWDDPAKLVSDFFCQPAVPVPAAYYQPVVDRLVADLALTDGHRQRMALVLPVYQIKWCCILLNELLPRDAARRAFAQATASMQARSAEQLEKSRSALHALTRTLEV
jgi:hypothetical protein